jgi:FtsZ-binding cell division protein ZapB
MSITIPIPNDYKNYDLQDLIEADEYDSDEDYYVEFYENTLSEHGHSYSHIKHLRHHILFFKDCRYESKEVMVNLGLKHKHLKRNYKHLKQENEQIKQENERLKQENEQLKEENSVLTTDTVSFINKCPDNNKIQSLIKK